MFHRLLIGMLALLLAAAPAAQATENEDRAHAVVQSLVSDAHKALTNGTDASALRGAIDRSFAFDIWERFLIEGREGAFDDRQRTEFRNRLPAFLAHLYHDQFGKGLDRAPVLEGTRKVRRDVMVSSKFPRPNGRNLSVDWRVRDQGGKPRVIDVMVGGTSFLLTKRDEFGAIIDRGGAPALLDYMRENAI